MLAAGALLFGSLIVACSPHGTGIIDEGTKTTAGTISANAVSGTTATLTDSTGGTYTFISGASASIVPVLSTASTPAGGTWTYKEKNISFNKYEGTFTGDIAKIGKEATSFKLTVKKVANAKGELMTAKKEASFDFNLTTSAFTATIPEVEASATKAEEEPEVVADPKTVVNAIWDFKTNITGKADNTTFTDADFTSKGSNDIESRSSEKEIGATLKVVGGSNIKWKDETSTNPNAYGLYTGAKKISDSYASVYQKDGYVYGKLELKTLDTAKLSFDVSSNTEGYNSWVVVTNAKGKIVAFKENLKKNEIETITTDKAVSAGTYTIWMQASRLHKVVAKNDLKADIVEIPVKTITLTSDKTTLKVGATTTATLTATVKGENDLIPNVTYELTFEVTEGADYVSLTQDTTNKLKATITVKDTVTSAQTVKIIAKAGTVKSEPVTITVDKASSVAKATAKTYDFTTLTTADLTALGVTETEGTDGNKKATAVISNTSATLSNGAFLKQSGSGKFKLEFTTKTAGSLDEAGAVKTINFNTSSTGNNSVPENITTLTTVADLANIISIPVDGAGTVTVSGKLAESTGTTSETSTMIAILYDATGNKIASQSAIIKDGAELSTLTGSVSDATTVYIVFYRSEGKGGLKISKIEVTPAE